VSTIQERNSYIAIYWWCFGLLWWKNWKWL